MGTSKIKMRMTVVYDFFLFFFATSPTKTPPLSRGTAGSNKSIGLVFLRGNDDRIKDCGKAGSKGRKESENDYNGSSSLFCSCRREFCSTPSSPNILFILLHVNNISTPTGRRHPKMV